MALATLSVLVKGSFPGLEKSAGVMETSGIYGPTLDFRLVTSCLGLRLEDHCIIAVMAVRYIISFLKVGFQGIVAPPAIPTCAIPAMYFLTSSSL